MSIDKYDKTQRLLKENIFKRIKECVRDYYTNEEYGKNPIERRIYISEIGNVAISDMPYFITSQEKKGLTGENIDENKYCTDRDAGIRKKYSRCDHG